MPDPEPVLNWYRVLTFIVACCSALALMDVIPATIKPWLVVVSMVISLALTVFFKVSEAAMPNQSIARRVVNKVSGGGSE
jgi:hypothetical protein